MCALKDELRVGREGGDEVNEMTAMTPSPTDGEEVTLENNNLFTSSTERGKAYFRRMKSPKLLCLSGVLSLFLLAYTLAKIIMGSSYLDYCPADPFIPIYLIISGCLTFIIIFIIYVIVYVRAKKKKNDTLTSTVYLVAFVYLFIHIVLHLAGSVCVIVKEMHIKDLRLYNVTGESVTCSETLIDFSMGLVVFELVVIGVIFIVTGLFIAEAIREVCCPKYSAVPSPHSPTAVIVNDNYRPPT